jgi:DNA mismatch endonuclease (patch repair protein)
MPDFLSKKERSRLMSRIKGKNSALEKFVFIELKRRRFKFRKHVKKLAGSPDVAFVRKKLVVFVDGDFWHGYKYAKWGARLKPFWRDKIESNMRRDRRNFAKLRKDGWTVLRVWGHQIKKRPDQTIGKIVATYREL